MTLRDPEGYTVVHLAVMARSTRVVRRLVRAAMERNRREIWSIFSAPSAHGLTPLHLAIEAQAETCCRILLESCHVNPTARMKLPPYHSPLDMLMHHPNAGIQSLLQDYVRQSCSRGSLPDSPRVNI